MLDASAIELNEAVNGRDLLQQKPIIVEPLLGWWRSLESQS